MGKANAAGYYEGRIKTADWWARGIGLLSIVISVGIALGTFWYVNLKNGKLTFWKPNMYAVEYLLGITSNNLVIAFPVSVTNDGAVVHTVNFLYGRVTSKNKKWSKRFNMCLEPDALPAKNSPLATSFAIPPRSSCMKLISFWSEYPRVRMPPGQYDFELYTCSDGAPADSKPDLTFAIDISKDAYAKVMRGLCYVDYVTYIKR